SARRDQPLYAAAFRPGADFLAYGGRDRKIRYRDLRSGSELVLPGRQPYEITALGFSPDGTHLAVGDESCDIWVYQVDPPKLLFHSKHHHECWLNSVSWTLDGERFLFGCRPNAHAGKPALFEPNVILEARQAEAARNLDPAIAGKDREIRDRAKSPELRRVLTETVRNLKTRKECVAAHLERGGRASEAKRVRESLDAESLENEALRVLAGPAAAPAASTIVGETDNNEDYDASRPAEDAVLDPALDGAGWNTAIGAAGGAGGAFAGRRGAVRPLSPALAAELLKNRAEIDALREKFLCDPVVRRVQDERKALCERQQAEVRKAAAELRQGFNANQWKIRKKK
ncbi:MAG: WD40 repeat domain-containing protein, partial [Planctomycetes bacterium]|nr:WD40 repeat domain-containing protein [Planctomycetota bacterium]